MKRFTLLLLLSVCCLIQLSAQTAKAIYCDGNKTLYFVYDNTSYSEGGTYRGNTITAVYDDLESEDWDCVWLYDDTFYDEYLASITTVQFESSFKDARPEYLIDWFGEFSSLTTINGIKENLNTSEVMDMSSMFYGCESLTSLDVSGFNTSNVTDMSYMFYGCSSLTSLDLSNFNTSEVTDMSSMFGHCESLTSLDLSNFNTSNVIDMGGMFFDCNGLTSLNVGGSFDTSEVTNMSCMFYGCEGLTSLDVSKFNTSKVKSMYHMFRLCKGLTSLDVSKFNTSEVTDMSYMFSGCRGLTFLDVSKFNTSNVTTMGSMFSGCSGLTSLDLSKFNTSNVTEMNNMFSGCSGLTSLDVSKFNTSNVTNMGYMFSKCSSLTSLDVSGWDTSNVTFMGAMFSKCSSLTSLDVSGFNTGNVTGIDYMFSECNKLRSLTFGKNFSIDKVESSYNPSFNSSWVFGNCTSLRYIDFYASDDTDAIMSVDRTTDWAIETMFNHTPQTTVIYLPHGSQEVTDAINVVYSYGGDAADLRCPNYYSEDKVDMEIPRAFKTNKAEYSRASMTSTYGTVVLPYDFTTNDDIQAYTLDEEHSASMTFKDTETVPAHTPFAFKKLGTPQFIMEDANSNFGITVKATNSTSAAEGGTPYTANTNLSNWTTKGYYVNEKVTLDDYSSTYYIAGDKFYQADGPLTLYPHRVTFQLSSGASGAKCYDIAVSDGQVTDAIEAADMRKTEREAQDIYDMQGRRLDSLRHGVNIVRMSDGSMRKVIKK